MVGQPGFFALDDRHRAVSEAGAVPERAMVDWAFRRLWLALFQPEFEAAPRRSDRGRGGRRPYDAVLMFKVLVLQTLDTLSDDQTEYQLRDRLSLMRLVRARPARAGAGREDALAVWGAADPGGAIERLFRRFGAALRDQGIVAPRPAVAGRCCADGSDAATAGRGANPDGRCDPHQEQSRACAHAVSCHGGPGAGI